MAVVGSVAAPAHAQEIVSSCPGFDVGVTRTGPPNPGPNGSFHRLYNVLAAGHSKITLENMNTGATVTVHVAGSVSSDPTEPVPGATTFFSKGTSLVLLRGAPFEPEGPSTTLYTGTVALQDNNDVITVRSLSGTTADICAVLAA